MGMRSRKDRDAAVWGLAAARNVLDGVEEPKGRPPWPKAVYVDGSRHVDVPPVEEELSPPPVEDWNDTRRDLF